MSAGLNLLIAIMSESYDRVQAMAIPVHARDLVQLALDMNTVEDFENHNFENGHVVHILTREGTDALEESHVVDKSQTSRITKKIDANVDKRIADLADLLKHQTAEIKQELELFRAELAQQQRT